MYGIFNDNYKFILLDTDRERLRAMALQMSKEETYIVEDFNEQGEKIGEHTKKRFVPMFTEETVDDVIQEFSKEDIITVEGSFYLKGYAPEPSAESIIAKDEQFLKDTDWYVSRYAEPNGKEIPEDILEARQKARDEISRLRGDK